MNAWYEEHFQTDYIKIYQHRHSEAGSELKDLLELIPWKKGQSVLDLCCGYEDGCEIKIGRTYIPY